MSKEDKVSVDSCAAPPPGTLEDLPAGPRHVFTISNMDCPTEENLIRKRLDSVPGVTGLRFNLMKRELTVVTEEPGAVIQAVLQEIGMEAVPKAEASSLPEAEQASDRWTWALIGLSGVLALTAEALTFAGIAENAWPVIVLALLSIAAGGKDTLRRGWVALKTFTLNINFLMSLAVAGAMVIGQWPEAAMVTFLFAVAEMIESYSLERARHAIQQLMALSPELARVKGESGQWQDVQARAVTQGQIVQVRPGDRVPLDGEVVAGQSAVNQAPITGESLPVEKQVGDAVFAGTINENGVIEVRVTADYNHTALSRIIQTVQEAQAQQAPTQRFVDEFARYYTPAVVAIALLVVVVPTVFMDQPLSTWLYRGLVMLVIACPCALVISTPVTVVSALAAAARRGILIKGGVYLEGGRKLTLIALDKTGTLTRGRPAVTEVISLDAAPAEQHLQRAASLDAQSTHPIAMAIVNQAVNQKLSLADVEAFDTLPGRGVTGRIQGQRYYLGNHRLIEERVVCSPAVEAQLRQLESEGKTAVILATTGKPLAIIAVADTVRESSVQAIHQLTALGVGTLMLSGDNQKTAEAIAAQVGISRAMGELLPEDKQAMITRLQASGHVVGMVGDGINDAPALAQSFIGFAMGAAGTDTAIETADVALMDDDLRKLPEFISLSRKASRVLWQNITLAIGIKVVFFGLALVGMATLWMAVFADMGASLIVVFNGLRLLREKSHADA